jgi:hypothetical protein
MTTADIRVAVHGRHAARRTDFTGDGLSKSIGAVVLGHCGRKSVPDGRGRSREYRRVTARDFPHPIANSRTQILKAISAHEFDRIQP